MTVKFLEIRLNPFKWTKYLLFILSWGGVLLYAQHKCLTSLQEYHISKLFLGKLDSDYEM